MARTARRSNNTHWERTENSEIVVNRSDWRKPQGGPPNSVCGICGDSHPASPCCDHGGRRNQRQIFEAKRRYEKRLRYIAKLAQKAEQEPTRLNRRKLRDAINYFFTAPGTSLAALHKANRRRSRGQRHTPTQLVRMARRLKLFEAPRDRIVCLEVPKDGNKTREVYSFHIFDRAAHTALGDIVESTNPPAPNQFDGPTMGSVPKAIDAIAAWAAQPKNKFIAEADLCNAYGNVPLDEIIAAHKAVMPCAALNAQLRAERSIKKIASPNLPKGMGQHMASEQRIGQTDVIARPGPRLGLLPGLRSSPALLRAYVKRKLAAIDFPLANYADNFAWCAQSRADAIRQFNAVGNLFPDRGQDGQPRLKLAILRRLSDGGDALGHNIRKRRGRVEITASQKAKTKLVKGFTDIARRFAASRWHMQFPNDPSAMFWQLERRESSWARSLRRADTKTFRLRVIEPLIEWISWRPERVIGADPAALLRRFELRALAPNFAH